MGVVEINPAIGVARVLKFCNPGGAGSRSATTRRHCRRPSAIHESTGSQAGSRRTPLFYGHRLPARPLYSRHPLRRISWIPSGFGGWDHDGRFGVEGADVLLGSGGQTGRRACDDATPYSRRRWRRLGHILEGDTNVGTHHPRLRRPIVLPSERWRIFIQLVTILLAECRPRGGDGCRRVGRVSRRDGRM